MTEEQKKLIGQSLMSTELYEALCEMIGQRKISSASVLTRKFSDPITKISRMLEASGECSVLDQLAFDLRVYRNDALKLKGLNPES